MNVTFLGGGGPFMACMAKFRPGKDEAGAAAGLRQTQDAMRRKAAGGRAVRLKPEIYRVDP